MPERTVTKTVTKSLARGELAIWLTLGGLFLIFDEWRSISAYKFIQHHKPWQARILCLQLDAPPFQIFHF